MEKHTEQHGALVALALLNIIDSLSTITTLGRYSLELEDKVLFCSDTAPDEATFITVIRDVFKPTK